MHKCQTFVEIKRGMGVDDTINEQTSEKEQTAPWTGNNKKLGTYL